jgi:hypothetical protein
MAFMEFSSVFVVRRFRPHMAHAVRQGIHPGSGAFLSATLVAWTPNGRTFSRLRREMAAIQPVGWSAILAR